MKNRSKRRKQRRRGLAVNAANPLTYDPTLTVNLRRQFVAELDKRLSPLHLLAVNFDPDEARDEKGQWTAGGANDLGEAAQPKSRFFGLLKPAATTPIAPVHDAVSLQKRLDSSKDYAEASKEIDKQYTPVWTKLAHDSNSTPDEVKKEAVSQAQKLVDGMQPYIRVSEKVLPLILQSGRFQTQFETGKSDGAITSPKARDKVEAEIMGIPHNISPKFRPVSAYFSQGFDHASEEFAGHYGAVMVKLKDGVRGRSTVTFGDSLQAGANKESVAAPATHVTPQALNPEEIAAYGKSFFTPKGFHEHKPFVEAQVHGGLSVKDIDEIGFPRTPDTSTQSSLSQLGIKWRVLPGSVRNMIRFIANLFGFAPALHEVYKAKDTNQYIVVTSSHGILKIGVLVDVDADTVSPEQPTATICRFMPYTDFQPFRGRLPKEVLNLLKRHDANIYNFNPNHDDQGRFSTGGSDGKSSESSGGGSEPAGQTSASGLRSGGGLAGSTGGMESPRSPLAGEAPLLGLPPSAKIRGVGEVSVGPDPRIRQAARDYMHEAGLPYDPPRVYVKVDPERAKRIAGEYDRMPHAPNDPLVKAAYEQMSKEVVSQYRAALKAGLKVDFIDFARQGDPYAASPRLAIEDIKHNNHMWVFPTSAGFGSNDAVDVSNNPLLKDSGFKISGQPASINDLFRVVHDYYGHAKEGVGMRADGEENAWRSHSAMFSPLARRAMTSETRGQNSWVNFGPFAEKNKHASGADTVYADQKTGLLPEWVSTEGAHDPPSPLTSNFNPNQLRDERGRWTGGTESSDAERLLESIHDAGGGFTYQATTGREPHGGYVVSPYPERSVSKSPKTVTPDDVMDYLNANKDLLKQPDHYLGAWHDGGSGKIYLDVSVVKQKEVEARQLALEHDQIAYFNLNEFKEVIVNPHATSGGAVGVGYEQPRSKAQAAFNRHEGNDAGRRAEPVPSLGRPGADSGGSRQGAAALASRTWTEVTNAIAPCLDAKLWSRFLGAAYLQGAGRAFDDGQRATQAQITDNQTASFYQGSRNQFVRNVLECGLRPALTGVYREYQRRLTPVIHSLHSRLSQAQNPQDCASAIINARHQFATLARLAVVRAHAEGQLDGYEQQGIASVKVVAEKGAACSHLHDTVMNVAEARGSVPRHAACRCAWRAAKVVNQRSSHLSALEAFSDLLANFNPDQPRDEKGKWTNQGDGDAQLKTVDRESWDKMASKLPLGERQAEWTSQGDNRPVSSPKEHKNSGYLNTAEKKDLDKMIRAGLTVDERVALLDANGGIALHRLNEINVPHSIYLKYGDKLKREFAGVAIAPTSPVTSLLPKLEKQHPPVAKMEDIESGEEAVIPGTEKIKSAKVSSSEKLDAGGANSSFKVTFEDGSHGVWKPRDGEDTFLREGIPGGTQYKREAAAYAVAQVVGISDLMPPTTVREVDGKIGSMQQFVEGGRVAHRVFGPGKYDGETDLKRAAVFDYLVGNTDRHDGNYMLTYKESIGGKLNLIDHGLILPTNYDDTFINRNLLREAQIHRGRGSTGYKIPADVVHLSEKWPEIEKALRAAHIEEEAITLTKERLGHLTHTAAVGGNFGDLPELWEHLGEDL